ncbi:28c35c73-5e92-4596-a877-cc5bae2677df [Thermothielavioides terrestris]
MSDAT